MITVFWNQYKTARFLKPKGLRQFLYGKRNVKLTNKKAQYINGFLLKN